ncbi:hypothetical protein GcM1_189017 [Golovinomyces cichoracearum]|uniref:DUF8035 domain-containing protein n=1 Tax=Golovinomyces cichoracearum TaxID=62708 RepID=A0A420J1Y5_9PEZI|nr:hypothetical protein GcM1_189017 [Golovinomyces cichoracearum]
MYPVEMSQDQHRSSSHSRLQRRDDERFAQGYNRSRHRSEQELDPENKKSKAHYRDRSMSRSKLREPSLASDHARYYGHKNVKSDLQRLSRERRVPQEYERERQLFYSPSPPRRSEIHVRPKTLRRQSSLDIFDRKPSHRNEEIKNRGPPIWYREPSHKSTIGRQPPYPDVSPPRRYTRDRYDSYQHNEPYVSDYEHPGINKEHHRGRNFSYSRRRMREKRGQGHGSDEGRRSSSLSSNRSSTSKSSVRSEYPKRGKTKIPVKLIHRKAIIDLGYPFEENEKIITIFKALGRDNIEDLIELSERYEAVERVKFQEKDGYTDVYSTNYSSNHHDQDFRNPNVYARSLPLQVPAPPINNGTSSTASQIFVTHLTKLNENSQEGFSQKYKDESSIDAEIKALQAEKEVLRAQRLADNLELESRGITVSREERSHDGYHREFTVVRRDKKGHSHDSKSHNYDHKSHDHDQNSHSHDQKSRYRSDDSRSHVGQVHHSTKNVQIGKENNGRI